MTNSALIPPVILKRKAVVYVRQSSQSQVLTNRRARAAHKAHNALLNGYVSLIEGRKAKHPDRGLPASLIEDIGRRWKGAEDDFRLVFLNKMRNTKGIICERRIGYHGLIHPDWDTTERNVVIAFAALGIT